MSITFAKITIMSDGSKHITELSKIETRTVGTQTFKKNVTEKKNVNFKPKELIELYFQDFEDDNLFLVNNIITETMEKLLLKTNNKIDYKNISKSIRLQTNKINYYNEKRNIHIEKYGMMKDMDDFSLNEKTGLLLDSEDIKRYLKEKLIKYEKEEDLVNLMIAIEYLSILLFEDLAGRNGNMKFNKFDFFIKWNTVFLEKQNKIPKMKKVFDLKCLKGLKVEEFKKMSFDRNVQEVVNENCTKFVLELINDIDENDLIEDILNLLEEKTNKNFVKMCKRVLNDKIIFRSVDVKKFLKEHKKITKVFKKEKKLDKYLIKILEVYSLKVMRFSYEKFSKLVEDRYKHKGNRISKEMLINGFNEIMF